MGFPFLLIFACIAAVCTITPILVIFLSILCARSDVMECCWSCCCFRPKDEESPDVCSLAPTPSMPCYMQPSPLYLTSVVGFPPPITSSYFHSPSISPLPIQLFPTNSCQPRRHSDFSPSTKSFTRTNPPEYEAPPSYQDCILHI